ncbi:hypothetical protein K505DRAFT_358940 [Melanomma pulvis-pyrius CBS 109.77]|uniref:Uncharacterized protein n=1 Tax=Melanomma pulvis-pyrius CBS 109.77 TaxID=1314802 RepID=A0A6A6XKY5_9PLEO|nr:hypothetical protein K505DRAFT_358940 [Melanomma pulvis-pyrius CBS 109.77]
MNGSGQNAKLSAAFAWCRAARRRRPASPLEPFTARGGARTRRLRLRLQPRQDGPRRQKLAGTERKTGSAVTASRRWARGHLASGIWLDAASELLGTANYSRNRKHTASASDASDASDATDAGEQSAATERQQQPQQPQRRNDDEPVLTEQGPDGGWPSFTRPRWDAGCSSSADEDRCRRGRRRVQLRVPRGRERAVERCKRAAESGGTLRSAAGQGNGPNEQHTGGAQSETGRSRDSAEESACGVAEWRLVCEGLLLVCSTRK